MPIRIFVAKLGHQKDSKAAIQFELIWKILLIIMKRLGDIGKITCYLSTRAIISKCGQRANDDINMVRSGDIVGKL